MSTILLSGGNLPFTVALAVLLGLSLLEILSWALGFALSHALDSALNVDMDHGLHVDHGVDVAHGVHLDHGTHVDVPADHGVHVDHGTGTTTGHLPMAIQFLDWIHVGAVPILVLFLLFLMGFGVSGILIQEAFGRALPAWLAAIPAAAMGFATVKTLGGAARRWVFREDTSAVSRDRLVGLEATITLGATTKGHPTQAKLKDQHGLTHYLIVEALRDGDEFDSGDSVLLVQRDGHKYYVIENSVDTLLSLGPEDLTAEHRLKA